MGYLKVSRKEGRMRRRTGVKNAVPKSSTPAGTRTRNLLLPHAIPEGGAVDGRSNVIHWATGAAMNLGQLNSNLY